MEKIKYIIFAHKVTAILVLLLVLLGTGGVAAFQKFTSKPSGPLEEVDLYFDPEGPFALIFPRRDGNALVLNLKRTGSYDAISYELAYTSKAEEMAVEGSRIKEQPGDGDDKASLGVIDRGAQGTIDTKDKKGEYEQEILFGTCSKNVCKYDKGVENGTLTLHIIRASSGGKKKAYKMMTQWHLQKPDVALGILTSGDNHFTYRLSLPREELARIGYTIINDLTGAPKLPSGKSVLGKVYALNVPIAKSLPGGEINLELAENPPGGVKIFRFDNEWEELDTKVDGSKLSAKADGAGIFAVLTSK